MYYSFSIEHAQKYGVNEAIMIYNFSYWIQKNKANGKHHYDGRTWTYNSKKAFHRLFPFWTERQIRTILANLLKQKVLITGNFNQHKYDKTLWYAFVDETLYLSDLSIGQKSPIDWTEKSNAKEVYHGT